MLPAKPEMNKTHSHDDGPIVRAGEWWRLVDPDHELAQRATPEHGLVLLVSEVRWIDGDMHTIVLSYHPRWGSGTVKMLVEEFLQSFVLEPDGEALRAQEIDDIMAEVNGITNRMNQGPADEEIQKMIEDRRAKNAAKTADQGDAEADNDAVEVESANSLVPSALFPSQDIVAAQRQVEEQLEEMNARRDWVVAQTEEINENMKLVGRYHKENANQRLAAISDKTNEANGMLRDVHTMRLFLGEELNTVQLTEGKSAPADAALVFMQRMLYLDEEIFIEGALEDGFDAKKFGSLSEIFESRPDIVARMMPYERCVVITRVRHNRKPVEDNGTFTLADAFRVMQEQANDKLIQILIRDGENIHMVEADEETSGAERLFPSADEIDRIFSENRFGREKGRAITPTDIDYSDRRSMHDNRALFYKRFLIILWGIHEREGLFGPFMPKGRNWLEETTHSTHFKFVHDEEMVLDDGRLDVHEFIQKMNAKIGSGSRVVAHWKRLLTFESAPGMFEEQNYGSRISDIKIADQVEDCSVVIAKQKRTDLTVNCRASRHVRSTGESKEQNYTVSLWRHRKVRGREDNAPMRVERDHFDGFLCLDDVTAEDLTYYIESRRDREHYLEYIQMFAAARRILLTEKPMEEQVREQLDALGDEHAAEVRTQAIRLWRKNNSWAWPEKDAHFKLIRKLADMLVSPPFVLGEEDAVEKRLAANGNIVLIKPAKELPLKKYEIALADRHEFKIGARGKATEVGTAMVNPVDRPITEHPLKVMASEIAQGYEAAAQSALIWPLQDRKSAEILCQASIASEEFDALHKLIGGTGREEATEWAGKLHTAMDKASNKYVVQPPLTMSLGVAVGNLNGREQPYVVSANVYMMELLWLHGHEDLVEDVVRRIYRESAHQIGTLRNKSKASLLPTIRMHPLGTGRTLHEAWQPKLDWRVVNNDSEVVSYAAETENGVPELAMHMSKTMWRYSSMSWRGQQETEHEKRTRIVNDARSLELTMAPACRELAENLIRARNEG